jgi:hypothetical protein
MLRHLSWGISRLLYHADKDFSIPYKNISVIDPAFGDIKAKNNKIKSNRYLLSEKIYVIMLLSLKGSNGGN